MNFRKSRVLNKLRNDEVVTCTKINFADPRVTEIASMSGFDCLWLDMEHVPTDWASIENQIRSAKIYDVDVMVRVRKGSYSDYLGPLEADAAGIMVPHLISLQEAKEIVKNTRFHPIGFRPVDGGNADGKYCMLDFNEYLEKANKERFITVQIEDVEPLNELEQIAELEGIDMIFFGPGDFSQSIGKPGQMDAPEVIETRKRVAQVSRKAGKYPATVGSPENFQQLVDMGYQFISIGADVVGLANYFKGLLSEKTSKNNKSGKIY